MEHAEAMSQTPPTVSDEMSAALLAERHREIKPHRSHELSSHLRASLTTSRRECAP
jgi:hypothetical protein